MKIYPLVFIFCFLSVMAQAQNLAMDAIWSDVAKNDIKSALAKLESAYKKDKQNNDLIASYLLVAALDAEPFTHSDKFIQLCKNQPTSNENIYALYQSESALANKNLSKEFALTSINNLLSNKTANPTVKLMAMDRKVNYMMEKMMADSMEWAIASLKGLRHYSLLGPFEDEFNSAYNTPHDALKYPELNHEFTNENGVKLKWYIPGSFDNYPWVTKMKYFDNNNNLVFAQSFFDIASDGDYKIGLGYSGNIKIWVDDQLVHNEKETRVCDVNTYTYNLKLKAGTHRVLVHFGSYTANVPSFIVTILDSKGEPINVKDSGTPKPYVTDPIMAKSEVHFAEQYFESKYAANPKSLYNALMLSRAYMRSHKMKEVLKVLHEIEAIYPDCGILHLALVNAYESDNNETKSTKYVNEYKRVFPNAYQTLSERYQEELKSTNKERAIALLDSINILYPNLTTIHYNTLAKLGVREEYIKLIDEVKKLYKSHKDDRGIVEMMKNVAKDVDGDEKESIKIIKEFTKNNFDESFYYELLRYYQKNNEKDNYINLVNSYARIMPYNPAYKSGLIQYHFNRKEFDKSKEVIDELLTYRPYVSKLYREIGDLYYNTDEKEKSISYYADASKLKPQSYYLKNKIYNLKYKKDIADEIEMMDPDKVLKEYKNQNIKEEGHDIITVMSESAYIRPGGGGTMHIIQYMLELKNQKALDDWQRLDFSSAGSLNIDKAQVYKKNGTKIDGERHGDEVVFTNMEIGDFLYVKYNEENSASGKLAKFWDESFNLNGYRPTFKSRYQTLIDKDETYRTKLINNNIQPKTKQINNFELKSYELNELSYIKSEPYSNGYDSLAQAIHIGSMSDWSDIVQWYEAISDEQSNAEFDADLLTKEIFEKDINTYSNKAKAEKIFNYIIKNIQYSSIPFRQSGIIPQRASDVYHTKIGDCKDVSNLYKAIARTVGLEANLVLISTYDNGKNEVVIPSLNFNHCMVKVNVDNKPYYLELTDPSINFGTLDYYHQNANILEINSKVKTGLTQLVSTTQNENKSLKKSVIDVKDGNKINVNTTFTGYGKKAALYRGQFKDSQDDAKKESIINMVSPGYENTVTLQTFELHNIDTITNDVSIDINYSVDKAITKIGSLYSFKLPFTDIIFDPNTFASSERLYSFDMNQYENLNTYEESFEINLKNNLVLESLPENLKLNYEDMEYELNFVKINDKKLNVIRKYKASKKIISYKNFEAFKEFVNSIIEAENTNIALKIQK